MEISGIPDGVPRARIVELVEELGIDVKDLISLRIEHEAIYAEVYARSGGRHYWDGSWDKNIAAHVIAIPIQDAPSSAEVGRDVVDAIKEYESRRQDDDPDPQPA